MLEAAPARRPMTSEVDGLVPFTVGITVQGLHKDDNAQYRYANSRQDERVDPSAFAMWSVAVNLCPPGRHRHLPFSVAASWFALARLRPARCRIERASAALIRCFRAK